MSEATTFSVGVDDYPLAVSKADQLQTPTGKHLNEITIEAAMSGDIEAADLRIAPDTLRLQAEIADGVGRTQLGDNFRRAAELTAIPDERVLAMYNALRPHASTADELLAIADELENEHGAPLTAVLVREAVTVYQRRDLLLDESEGA